MNKSLFNRFPLGPYILKNRMVMAPLTRSRSQQPGNIPSRLNAFYYAQRAGAGLIISEATQISAQGQGYAWTPGIHTVEQIEGWKLVSEAVHDADGIMFMQLWHVGRISHPRLQPEGGLPVAPSAIAPTGMAFVTDTNGKPEFLPFVTPRALRLEELPQIVKDYAVAAKNAMTAGLDGVEIHAANGYLLDQFLNSSTNHRTDEYGGSIENRSRMLLEVVEAVIKVCGAGCVGVRLSPLGTFNDMGDADPESLFTYLAEQLNNYELAYLHVVDPGISGNETLARSDPRGKAILKTIRDTFKGTLILCGGYTFDTAGEAIAYDQADLVAFGRLFLANPDLPERFRENALLNSPNPATFYGGGAIGYVDYPTLKNQSGEEAAPDFKLLEGD
jgi:N-ethylmaleimide reductase